MAKECSFCSSVQNLVKEPHWFGVSILQRKKNLSLLAAAYLGNEDCVDILVKEGADVNCTDVLFDQDCRKKIGVKVGYTETCGDLFTLQDGGAPLVYAAAIGNIENIVLLIQEGGDVNLIRNNKEAIFGFMQSLPEFPTFMQYCTWRHVHVVRVSSARRPHVICMSSTHRLHVICMSFACHLCMHVSSVHARMLSTPGHVICTLSAGHLHHSSWSLWA